MTKQNSDKILAGIVYYCLAIFFVATMDACAKWLTDTFPIGQMMFYRGLFGILPILAMFYLQIHNGTHPSLLPVNVVGQMARGLFVAMVTLTLFFALSRLPLPEVTAIVMTGPILMVVLGSLLGETSSVFRWICAFLSFFGVLLITKPTHTPLEMSGYAAFASAVFYSLAAFTTRHLTRTDSNLQIMVWTAVVVFFFGVGLSVFEDWSEPVGLDWLLLALLGVTGGISNTFFIAAFQNAEISLLAPFDYSIFLWAVLFSLLLFGEVPSAHVWFGAALIAASGILAVRKYAN